MRIAGLSVWGVLVASIAFYMVGFVFYGLIFSDMWMEAVGITAAEAEASMSPGWMLAGLFISVASVKGLAFVLKWRGWPGLGTAIGTTIMLWAFFAVPLLAYDLIYMPDHNFVEFFIDLAHIGIGWIIAAIILTVMN